MTVFPRNPPNAPMTREIGFLIFDGFQLLDAAGPIAAFEIAGARRAPAPIALQRARRTRRAGRQLVRRDDEARRASPTRRARHAGRRRRRRHARGARRRGILALSSAPRRAMRGASPASARARFCSPRPACSTASARRRIGAAAGEFARALSQRAARARPHLRPRRHDLDVRPASPPASTSRWR